MKLKYSQLSLAVPFGLALVTGSNLHAQTPWDGGGGSSDYSNANNWNPNTIPGNGNANGALIGSSANHTVIYNTATSYTSNGTGKANSLLVGTGTNGVGSLTLSGSAGTLTFGGDAYSNAAWIGSTSGSSNATGTVTVSAGKLAIGSALGTDASINLGVSIDTNPTGTKSGTLIIDGGTVEVGRRLLMGANAVTATGVFTISSGTLNMRRTGSNAEADNGMIRLGTGNNTVNLDGGTAILSGIHLLDATNARSNIYFNGTTLKANVANTDFITGTTAMANLQIKNGGLIFDTNNFAVTINDALSNFSGHTGFLRKEGLSTLTLSTANTYSGNTTIKAGTLALGASGTFDNSPIIVVGDAGSSGTALDLTSKASFAFSSGQTVKGIGTINIGAGKTITINGTLAKGNSIGTQAYTGNLTLAGNDQIELGNSTGAGTYASPYNSDLGNVSGNLTLGGTLSVIDNAGANSNGSISAGSYKIYTYGGTTSGSYSTITNATGYRADIVNNGAGTGSGQGIYLDNYRVAAATTTQTVTLNTRTGVAVSTSLSLTNANNSTAPYQENLGTTGFSGTTSGFTATGSATGIAGGGTGSGSLTVGVNAGTVGTAGIYSGSTTLGLHTEEVNSSGLGNAGVGNQTVTINVTAYDFATAAFSQTAGDGSLTGGGLSYTLDFGTGLALNTNYTATLQLANGLFSLYKDSLQGTYGTVGGAFSETAGNFASLISGGTDTFTISFFTGSTGTFTDTLTFNGTSLNTPLGNSALGQINIGISAVAIPEPDVALLGGLGMLALLRRRRD